MRECKEEQDRDKEEICARVQIYHDFIWRRDMIENHRQNRKHANLVKECNIKIQDTQFDSMRLTKILFNLCIVAH
jgi:hypothetical protein